MIKCRLCGEQYASEFLQVCVHCIREENQNALKLINSAYEKSRNQLNLPIFPPKSKNGVLCNFCINECRMDHGEWGFCGIRQNIYWI